MLIIYQRSNFLDFSLTRYSGQKYVKKTDRTSPVVNIVFGLTIFLSAFLLFQIQPMISKFILPWFGGGSGVWTTSQLFFQLLLLGGYAYAHFLNLRAPKRQARVHLLVLGGVFALLIWLALVRETPISPDPGWKPSGGAFPVWQVLGVLAASVGLPYLLLSTTSSLAQAWYRDIRRQGSPYVFYALSNAASLLALLTYPVLVEPAWTIKQQALAWSAGFVVYLAAISICAFLLLKYGAGPVVADGKANPSNTEEAIPPVGWKVSLYWVALAACSSVMLLATTNEITQDVASVPFLWVLPLSLYLLSFVIAFSDRFVHVRGVYVVLTLAALLFGYISLERGSSMPWVPRVAANAVMLLIICLLCHSELYARRPHPRHLTSFYLMVSIGGAVGGVFVSLVAPLIFSDFWEYHLGLVGAAVVAVSIVFQRRSAWVRWLRFPYAASALALVAAILYTPVYWFSGSVEMARSFYGVLRVRSVTMDGMPGYTLVHGGILHGSQVTVEPNRRMPTEYYTPSTGFGVAYHNHPDEMADRPMRVGMVGLGAGTVAAYGKPGDTFRFYEIDPNVVRIARDSGYFTYLQDSQAEIEIVLGDARLSMERELLEGHPQQYDLLAIDAFSGDSIPTHLINREAVALYLEHLDDDGILAFHISNRHLDLEPVVARLAEAYQLSPVVIHGGSQDWEGSPASWVLLARDRVLFDAPAIYQASSALTGKSTVRLWTDDYSNLFQVIRE